MRAERRPDRRPIGRPEDLPLRELLEGLSSGAPTPGGGAAAALTGAAAAGLVAMVARVTAARESLGAAAAQVARTATSADRLRKALTRSIGKDAEAFGAMLAARRAAGGRAHPRVQRALRGATEVPLDVARSSAAVLTLGAALAQRARVSTLSDLGTAGALGTAALDAGVLTAATNLADLHDRAFARRAGRELARLRASGARARRRLDAAVSRRLGSSPARS